MAGGQSAVIGFAFDPDERPSAPDTLVDIVGSFLALALGRHFRVSPVVAPQVETEVAMDAAASATLCSPADTRSASTSCRASPISTAAASMVSDGRSNT